MNMNIDTPPNDDWIKHRTWHGTRNDADLEALIADVRRSRRTALTVSKWAGYANAPARLREAVERALS